jgi:hypothetical protein
MSAFSENIGASTPLCESTEPPSKTSTDTDTKNKSQLILDFLTQELKIEKS